MQETHKTTAAAAVNQLYSQL